MVPLLHIMTRSEWTACESEIVAPSLEAEGFMHCSTAEQVLVPANERFQGVQDLVLLVIDPAAVGAEIVFEDCYDSGMAFPHVCGPIPTDAVRAVVDFPPGVDGLFQLPQSLPADV